MSRNQRTVQTTLTPENRKRLSEIYKLYTDGRELLPSDWNEAGAKALANGIIKMYKCSDQMSNLKAFLHSIPKKAALSWGWVVTTAYQFLKAQVDQKTGKVNVTCYSIGSESIATDVKYAILRGSM